MVKAHVPTSELVAGRYRLVDVVHRETNRVSYSGEDLETEHACLLTQIGLPLDQDPDTARRATSRILRTSERMELLRPGRVAAVLDAVEDAGSLWIVTEWIDGLPLGELLTRQGTFDYTRTARIGLELLDVLEAAHVAGITHGELSPGQVFVGGEDAVVVTGFGLAGATLSPRLAAPSYASPEQARDERVGPASDLWALGAILYSMSEGRPPYRERDRPEATLKGVDRLPLRAPVRSGPLTQAVQGLLRKDSRERLGRSAVRDALVRVLREEHGTDGGETPRPGPLDRVGAGPVRGRRALLFGTALAVVAVAAAAVLVATDGQDSRPPEATGTRTPPAGTGGGASSPAPGSPPSDAGTPGDALPDGYRTYTSPDGFSVALPRGWRPVSTTRAADLAYRVFLGAEGDPRRLAVTYSERLDPDPVAVWRDDVQPQLARSDGFRRIGEIEATTYQGYEAADMEWLSRSGGTQVHTFGRGFLLDDHRGFSLRWSTPARDWDAPGNREALDVFLRTFRVPGD
ncbi:serine/threonine protein kinase [Streptomyces sp. NPDC086669]|uniref:serine/threonine protein kinase n=1 Tax=Streptomyces sp. NPDC086669 TaxID=3365753 RepID=UPI0038243B3D